MNAIIFGVNGQDGFYLSELLRQEKIEVIGVSRNKGKIIGDIKNYNFVSDIIRQFKPSYIFHLAANSTTNHSAIFDNHEAICSGTLNILEAARMHCPGAKIFIAGSGLQFNNDGISINENTSFSPSSIYSVARIQAVYACRYFRDKFKLKVYIGYLFNHDSPLRSERHVNQKIITAVNRIENGSQEKISLGNISVKKEFGYAKDIANGIWHLLNQDDFYEAAIGTGKAYSLLDWLEICFSMIGKKWQDYVIIDNTFKSEYEILVSDPKTIFSTGWRPQFDINDLAKIMKYNKY